MSDISSHEYKLIEVLRSISFGELQITINNRTIVRVEKSETLDPKLFQKDEGEKKPPEIKDIPTSWDNAVRWSDLKRRK